MGFWLGTLIFFLIQVVVTGSINLFSKSPNKGLTHVMGCTAVFQCWLMWGIVYLAQLNPLIFPNYKA
jgi:V-type H+-transporting ATPase subunit e